MKNVKRAVVIVLSVLVILSAFTACGGKSPEKLILGAWRDSTGITGYEFKEDGKCVVTLMDVSLGSHKVFDNNIQGTYSIAKQEDGSYNVKIIYNILTATITKEYKFVVENSSLQLTDIKDGSVTVYMAYTPDASTGDTTAA